MRTILSETCGTVHLVDVTPEASKPEEIGGAIRTTITAVEDGHSPQIHVETEDGKWRCYDIEDGFTLLVSEGDTTHNGDILAVDITGLTPGDQDAMRRIAAERIATAARRSAEAEACYDAGYSAGWEKAKSLSLESSELLTFSFAHPECEELESDCLRLMDDMGVPSDDDGFRYGFRYGFHEAVHDFNQVADVLYGRQACGDGQSESAS